MSEYAYTNGYMDTLRFKPSIADPNEILLSVQVGSAFRGLHIPNADVPTVAAELLKAAGYGNLATYLGDVIETLKAEAEAEKKLQERRDALAKDLSDSYWDYVGASMPTKRAIDRIIELEDGASRD